MPMQLIDKLFKKANNKIPLTIGQRINGYEVQSFPEWNLVDNADKYCTVDDLYSVISYLATTAAMIPFFLYDDKGKTITGHVLETPSATMSAYEFFEAVYTLMLLDGEVFIVKEKLDLGANAGMVASLKIVSSTQMIISADNNYNVVKYISIDSKGVRTPIDRRDVIHIKTFNPANKLRGLSPIKALLNSLSIQSSANAATYSKLKNGGVDTIVYEKGLFEDAASIINSRKDNFFKFISNASNAGAPFFAHGEMGSINLGSSLADLKVLEVAKVSFKKICNAYKTSDILFNSDSASTESNVQEMVKRTYTNSSLPLVRLVLGAFTFGLEVDGKFKEDISEITELQEEMNKKVQSLNTAWWLTGNEKREAMGYSVEDNPSMNEILIPSNVVPLNDLNPLDLE